MGSSTGSNPGSKPDCVTRLIAELDQPHIRSPLIAAAPISRLRQAGLRTTRPFYDTAFRQGIARFVDLDPPGLSQALVEFQDSLNQAVFMTTPWMTTPVVTYFQRATSSLRASATIVDFLKRPLLCLTRSSNH